MKSGQIANEIKTNLKLRIQKLYDLRDELKGVCNFQFSSIFLKNCLQFEQVFKGGVAFNWHVFYPAKITSLLAVPQT